MSTYITTGTAAAPAATTNTGGRRWGRKTASGPGALAKNEAQKLQTKMVELRANSGQRWCVGRAKMQERCRNLGATKSYGAYTMTHPIHPIVRKAAKDAKIQKKALATAHVELETQSMRLPVDEVPIVDLAALRCGGQDHQRQRVASACRDWGFFQVVNHGVSMEFVDRFRKKCLDVFSLPGEQKDKISRKIQGSRWGYDFRPDHGPMEILQLTAWDSHQLLTFAQELFPDSSEDFVAICEEANRVLRTLAMEILDVLVEGLGVDAKHFQAHKNESQGVLRANYYHQSKAPDQVLGLIPHVDGNLFTILHQQDVCGLEVLKDGRWIPITPRNDAFCINVADIMQVLTNGKYRSVQHRAVVPKIKARLSFAYFLTPANGLTLIPAPELVDSEHPPLYRPFTWSDFVEATKGPARPYPSVLPFFEQGHPQS